MSERVLARSTDGRSKVVELADGSVEVIGWAEAPSGERRTVKTVVRQPRAAGNTVRVQLSGGPVEIVVPTVESPLARSMRYEAARLKALSNHGKVAATPPWKRTPVDPTPEELAQKARAALHAAELQAEDARRWKALATVADDEKAAQAVEAAKRHVEAVENGTYVAPEPVVPPEAVGTFADPETHDYVVGMADEARLEAERLWRAVEIGDLPAGSVVRTNLTMRFPTVEVPSSGLTPQ